jgi:RNA 3'-terminal phosphate cyclase (ATP)
VYFKGIRGYFPKGGGHVVMTTTPVKQLKPINLVDRGAVVSVHCRAFVAGTIPLQVTYVRLPILKFKSGEQMATQAHKTLHKYFGPKNTVKFEIEHLKEAKSTGNGIGLLLYAKTDTGCIIGASNLGEKGVPADKVGAEAANRLIFNLKKVFLLFFSIE